MTRCLLLFLGTSWRPDGGFALVGFRFFASAYLSKLEAKRVMSETEVTSVGAKVDMAESASESLSS